MIQMRHRVDISRQAKIMLKFLSEELSNGELALSATAEICIQSTYSNYIEGGVDFFNELNPTQSKLDEILDLLKEIHLEL